MQPNAQISLYKKELRKRMLAQRRALSVVDINKYNIIFSDRIISLEKYKKALKILVYLSMHGEPNLDEFIYVALQSNKFVYVPVCIDGNKMIAARIKSFDDLIIGMYGVRTVKPPYEEINAIDIDLALIPAVACDKKGNRLGMGRGYYDRYLESVPFENCVSVVWEFQIVNNIPTEKFDRKVSKIVTERRELL